MNRRGAAELRFKGSGVTSPAQIGTAHSIIRRTTLASELLEVLQGPYSSRFFGISNMLGLSDRPTDSTPRDRELSEPARMVKRGLKRHGVCRALSRPMHLSIETSTANVLSNRRRTYGRHGIVCLSQSGLSSMVVSYHFRRHRVCQAAKVKPESRPQLIRQ